MKNSKLKNIGNKLLEANKILLFTHVLMDGDTLGSSVALCKALRKEGKTAYILIEDTIPSYLTFLDMGYCTYDCNIIENPDICISIDCSDIERFIKRKEKFLEGKVSICLDHHKTNNFFADLNYINENASATGEIIYYLIKLMGIHIDVEMAEALYTAITTDTGNFQYTNTTQKTHLIAAKLFNIGIDLEKVSVELYQNIRLEKLKITTEVLNTLKILCNGKADIAFVTRKMLEETGATIDETEGIIETLRNISGVEISAFLKENHDKEIKVGLRAKTYGDVATIAMSFGGGGHKKAAGCTINASMDEAIELVAKAIEEHLSESDKEKSKLGR